MAGKPTASHHHHPPHPHVNVDQPHSGGWVVEGEVPIVFLGQRPSLRLGTPHAPVFFNSRSFFACVSPSFCQQFWVSYTFFGCFWFYRVSLVFYGLLRGSRLIVSPPWAEHLPGDILVLCFLGFLWFPRFSLGVLSFLWFSRISSGFLGFLRGSRLRVSPPWAEHLPGDSSLRRGNLILWLRAHPPSGPHATCQTR